MPRQPDPDLEERILNAADVLWKRGGEKSLTMRAVARAARTNTPAVYRRFKDRRDLVRALLRRIVTRIRNYFETAETLEEIAEAYLEFALRHPHEYELFYAHSRELSPRRGARRPRPIRETRPNFALVERLLAERLGGTVEDHTQLALALWATLHGTATMLLMRSIPEGHEEELRTASRAAVRALIERGAKFSDSRKGKRRTRPPR
jgi:AcrR family transcriptional regulator